MKRSMRALLLSTASLVLCFAMLIGTTYAWFTDSVESGVNQIIAGNLDVELEYAKKPDGTYKDITNASDVFVAPENSEKGLWEPGHTEVAYLKVTNKGDLALKYSLQVKASNEVIGKNAENEDIKLSEILKFSATEPSDAAPEVFTRDSAQAAASASSVKLTEYSKEEALGAGESHYVALVVYMPKEVGNEANYRGDKVPEIDFAITLFATQAEAESDSFGSDYDKEAFLPVAVPDTSASQEVSVTDNKVDTATTIDAKTAVANIPEGVEVTDKTLTLSVSDMDKGEANVTLGENEEISSLNVHIKGVAKGNTVPMEILLIEAAPKGMNQGNLKLYHVENGATNAMLYVETNAAFTEHNQFKYDPATGDVILYMATFSEVAVVADTEKAWEGNFDYSWYDASKTELIIANADQLAAFGAIVGGMNGQTQDSFAGKTVKLIADINLGDKESENNPDIIFYPIGYYNSEGTYERTNTAITSGLRNFEGTFDGNGHTVENFYHNTWEMKGDHDWYSPEEQYYRDGMGLFGRVYKGTVKNLTVKNFSSDGEIATTGVIAAYADGATFENIAVFNCNPRVYNIGNGGIVGCVGWYAKEANLKTTFKNITVDNSNKISALWGSYDVACGGIVGQYYPTSGQTSANKPANGGVSFENCHISAQMDVYNDVCANYQYYAYRYTGMLIGSVRENVTIDGHSYPKMDGITAENCTVHFGTWNDYYYCEIIDNTTASYTHDYQMSRLTEIKAIDGTTITYLDGTTGTVPASGRANYVIVDYTKGHGTENATCYHFKDGAVWTHEDAGYHNGENGEKYIDENGDGVADLKEDKQHIYLEFNNLVTGYGWGVTSRGFNNLDGVTNLDIAQGDQEASVDKFEAIGNINTYRPGQPIRVGDLFSAKDGVTISGNSVYVSVSAVVDSEIVSATFALDAEDWRNSTITFSSDSVANAKVTITDYIFCNSTEIVLTKESKAPKFTPNSVGDKDAYTQITLGDLFNAIDVAKIGEVSATVTSPDGTTIIKATNADWATKVINLNKSGSWTISIKDNDDYCTETAVTFNVNNINKFSANTVGAQNAYTQITLGEIFNAIDDDSKIGTVTATVIDPNNVTTTITGTSADWANKTITLIKDGEWTVSIVDDDKYCAATETTFTVNKVDKFTKKFDKNFLYRVGNQNTVGIGYIFGEIETAVKLSSVNVSITNVAGNAAGTFTYNATWTSGKLQFTGTGVVKVTISADGANPVEINLEVVDAVNATSAISATDDTNISNRVSNNVVLLNDISGGFTVSNGYAFYGNGFKVTCSGKGTYLNNGGLTLGYVNVQSGGILDNVQVICDIYPNAFVYAEEVKVSSNLDKEVSTSDRSRYMYQLSAIAVSGDGSVVANCYAYGGRNNIYVGGGNVTIENTVTECGTLANIQIAGVKDTAINTVTLKDVTTIQYKNASTYDSTKIMLGFGIMVGDNESTANPHIILQGDLKQYNWVTSDDKSVSNTYAKTAIEGALEVTKYQHTINGKTAVNMGIAYLNTKTTSFSAENDQRTNKQDIPYVMESVKISGQTGYVYSIASSAIDGTSRYNAADDGITPYKSNAQRDVIPKPTFSLGDQAVNGEDRYLTGDINGITARYESGQDAFTLDITKLMTANKYGSACTVNAICIDPNGNTLTGIVTLNTSGVYTLKFTVVDNTFYYLEGEQVVAVDKTIEYTYDVSIKLTISEPSVPNATLTVDADKNTSGKYTDASGGDKKISFNVLDPITVTDAGNSFTLTSNVKGVDITYSATANDGNGNAFAGNTTITVTYNEGQVLKIVIKKNSGNSPGDPKTITYDTSTGTVKSTSRLAKNSCTAAEWAVTSYSFTGKNGKTITANGVTFTIKADTSGGCVTPDTLVTLADGTQKRIDKITYEDQLLVWDSFKGEYASVSSAIIFNHGIDNNTVIELKFSDGTSVKVVNLHQFFDACLNKYVSIDADTVAQYVGHQFAKSNSNGFDMVTLVDYNISSEYVEAWGIISSEHYNIFVEGMLSTDFMVEDYDLFNYFAFGDNMVYDAAKMQADIETYGLYTYEDFADYLTYEQFEAFNVQYFKIAVGKGNYTFNGILALINTYLNA